MFILCSLAGRYNYSAAVGLAESGSSKTPASVLRHLLNCRTTYGFKIINIYLFKQMAADSVHKFDQIPEMRRKKVSLASASLPVVNCVSPASAFRHQGHSVGNGLVWHYPATARIILAIDGPMIYSAQYVMLLRRQLHYKGKW